MIQISSQSILNLEASVTLRLSFSFQSVVQYLVLSLQKRQWEVASPTRVHLYCFSISDLKQAQLSPHCTPIYSVTISFTDLPEFLAQNHKQKIISTK